MKKGFTLIELICVITILGLIALIAVPTVGNIINSSKEKAYEDQIATIEKTAKNYMAKNYTELPSQTKDASSCVSINKMKTAGLLSAEEIKDPRDETNITGGVKVTWNGSKYTYEYKPTENCEDE